MSRKHISPLSVVGVVAIVVAGVLLGFKNIHGTSPDELLNVSYDPTRELYAALDPEFVTQYRKQTGVTVVSDAAGIRADLASAGDEPLMLARAQWMTMLTRVRRQRQLQMQVRQRERQPSATETESWPFSKCSEFTTGKSVRAWAAGVSKGRSKREKSFMVPPE